MISRLYGQVKEEPELRQVLIELKTSIKEAEHRKVLQRCFEKEPHVLLNCLMNEDAKVRKHVAGILGNMSGDGIAEALFAAYNREKQLFVKGEYLKALTAFDLSPYLNDLEKRQTELEELLKNPVEDSDEKHLRQELLELRNLLFKKVHRSEHVFVGYEKPVDLFLMTNKGCEKLLAGQLNAYDVRLLKGGVLVEKGLVRDLLPIRTYREMLFCLKGSKKMPAEAAAELLLKTDLMELLDTLHEGNAPYYFRIDLKSKMEQKEKSMLSKRLAGELEEKSGGKLRSAPSAYEIEIRFVENKEGTFYPLLKLHTFPDKRFAYRKYTVAASMAPVQAAICMELAADYLKEEAKILDPFCGVGTMLLERNYKLHGNTLYGIDNFAPAVQGARENAEIAGVPAHFINRDSMTFTHKYRFDEIVTNFPVQGKSISAHDLDCLYKRFFDKAEELLTAHGIILLYSHDRGYAKKHLRMSHCWRLEKEWCVSEQEGAYLFCIVKEK